MFDISYVARVQFYFLTLQSLQRCEDFIVESEAPRYQSVRAETTAKFTPSTINEEVVSQRENQLTLATENDVEEARDGTAEGKRFELLRRRRRRESRRSLRPVCKYRLPFLASPSLFPKTKQTRYIRCICIGHFRLA